MAIRGEKVFPLPHFRLIRHGNGWARGQVSRLPVG